MSDKQAPGNSQKAQPEQECKHDWQYNFQTHIHECSKCGIPAPPNWNEVPF